MEVSSPVHVVSHLPRARANKKGPGRGMAVTSFDAKVVRAVECVMAVKSSPR